MGITFRLEKQSLVRLLFIFPVQITLGKTEIQTKVRAQCNWTIAFIARYNIHSRKILGRLKGKCSDLAAA